MERIQTLCEVGQWPSDRHTKAKVQHTARAVKDKHSTQTPTRCSVYQLVVDTETVSPPKFGAHFLKLKLNIEIRMQKEMEDG